MSSDFKCPVKKNGVVCGHIMNRCDIGFNNHLRFAHKGLKDWQRTALKMKHTPVESGFSRAGRTQYENDLSNKVGIK